MINIKPDSVYRISKLNLGRDGFRPYSFISINGKEPSFEPGTLFSQSDNSTRHFLWLKETPFGQNKVDKNEVAFNQYTKDGATIIISSQLAQIQLDFRQLKIRGVFICSKLVLNCLLRTEKLDISSNSAGKIQFIYFQLDRFKR